MFLQFICILIILPYLNIYMYQMYKINFNGLKQSLNLSYFKINYSYVFYDKFFGIAVFTMYIVIKIMLNIFKVNKIGGKIKFRHCVFVSNVMFNSLI